ncbi:MAG: cyclic nucleotide-binding domain-containing protein, partial [Pseudomonadota bacterium]
EEPLRLVAFSAERVRRREGQKLFSLGAPAFTALILVEGAVSFQDAGGDEVARIAPPALIGERALITDATRPATAIMAESGQLIEIPRLLMRRVLEEYPETLALVRTHLTQSLDAQLRAFEGVAERLDALG